MPGIGLFRYPNREPSGSHCLFESLSGSRWPIAGRQNINQNFEKAIDVSNGSNLMAKLLFAEKYARLVFDRELHDTLLKEVISSKIANNEATLINSIAQHKAEILLAQSDEYF